MRVQLHDEKQAFGQAIWLVARESSQSHGDERMTTRLTFEEHVELKLMQPKHADRAFVTAAEHMRERDFTISLSKASWHVRTRG